MLVSLAQARSAIARASFRPPAVERVPVLRSLGRLAAARVSAPFHLPPTPVSAMDGYALNVGDGASIGPFRVRGSSFPSSAPRRRRLAVGEAAYITTGAVLPPGANAVVRVEATAVEGDFVRLRQAVRAGSDIMPAGEAMRRGDVILERGEPIRPAHVAALLAQRTRTVPAYRLRVAVLPVGDELVPASAGRPSTRTEFMGPLVAGLLGFADVELRRPVPDRLPAVARALGAAQKRSDLLITIGGSSVGQRDVVKPAIQSVGRLLFEGVTTNVLKRGAVGFIGRTPIVVLPGQVVSAAVVFHEHALHVLSRMVGRELRAAEELVLGCDLVVDHRMDSTYLFTLTDGRATPLPWGVARLTALLRADGFGVLSHGRRYRSGERVRLQRLWGGSSGTTAPTDRTTVG